MGVHAVSGMVSVEEKIALGSAAAAFDE